MICFVCFFDRLFVCLFGLLVCLFVWFVSSTAFLRAHTRLFVFALFGWLVGWLVGWFGLFAVAL